MLRIHTRSKKHVIVFGGTNRVSAPMAAQRMVLSDVIAAPANCNNTNDNDHVDGTFRRVLAASVQEWGPHERR